MSRCKSCNHIMKLCDLSILEEDTEKAEAGILEDDICRSCRQEIFKCSDDCTEIAQGLGFSVEESLLMEEGLFIDYTTGGFQE